MFKADAALIDGAKAIARDRGTTLSAAFRKWLVEFAREIENVRNLDLLMKDL